MKKSSFGERLLRAFGNASHREIGDKLGVSRAAVGNYVDGRVPPIDTLLKIREATKCSLDWLLTGEGQQVVTSEKKGNRLSTRLEAIAREQSHVLFGEADIAGPNVEQRTLDLLTEFLIVNSLERFGLADGGAMSPADRKLAKKFSFVANAPQTLEDRMRDIIRETSAFDRDEIRDMIRDIVNEKGTPRMDLVMPIGDTSPAQKTRKTG